MGFNGAKILLHLSYICKICDSCHNPAYIYDRLAFLHIFGNQLSRNLHGIESRPSVGRKCEALVHFVSPHLFACFASISHQITVPRHVGLAIDALDMRVSGHFDN